MWRMYLHPRVIVGSLCLMTVTPETGQTPRASSWTPSEDDFGLRLAMVRHRMDWNIHLSSSVYRAPGVIQRSDGLGVR